MYLRQWSHGRHNVILQRRQLHSSLSKGSGQILRSLQEKIRDDADNQRQTGTPVDQVRVFDMWANDEKENTSIFFLFVSRMTELIYMQFVKCLIFGLYLFSWRLSIFDITSSCLCDQLRESNLLRQTKNFKESQPVRAFSNFHSVFVQEVCCAIPANLIWLLSV